MKETKVVKATAFNKSFEVVDPVIFLNLLTVFGEGTLFSSFFGCGSLVIEPCEESARLSCDDKN